LSVKRFIEEYEKPYIPVVIEGIPEVEKWQATFSWTFKKIKKNYKKAHLKCGEDDNGKSIRMKFKYFMKYLNKQTDDSPLYIFDSSFDDREDTKPLLEDYQVPKYFPQDLFELVGEDRRPPYRWFLVGPKRSGTCIHVDPLGTSAWNTLITGRKRWVLFPPEISKQKVKGKKFIFKGEDDEAVNYFGDILPRIKQANAQDPAFKCIEFIQYPGETVFVPGGWWHAVFNVEDTIAVTQNFCSAQNFEQVWKKTRSGRKRMAVKWLKKLNRKYPELAQKAKQFNEQDGFQMYQKQNKKQEEEEEDMKRSIKKRKKKHQSTSSSSMTTTTEEDDK
jgi:histone arginine demethylase JMJD6